jgi:hypothetical protein
MKTQARQLIQFLLWGVFLLLTMLWSVASAYDVADCTWCHRRGSDQSTLQIDMDAFVDSVHGKAADCMECHTGVTDDTHQTLKGSGAVECNGCHDQENRHGQAGAPDRRPQCYDCHTRHDIRPPQDSRSSVSAGVLPQTCATCHPVECGKKDYLSWLPATQIASHPKGDFGALYEKTNCLGCHQGKGAHGDGAVLNKDRCDVCHRSPGESGALWGTMHPRADHAKQPAIFAAAVMYQICGAGVLVLLLARVFRRGSGNDGSADAKHHKPWRDKL